MTPQTLEEQLVSLRTRVTNLERLPGQIEALTLQVSQLRTEMRDEFSAIRSELGGEMRQMRDELASKIYQQGVQMRTLHSEALAKIDEQGVQMRVLHEEVISRIAVLSEHRNGRRRTGRKQKQ